MIIKTLNNEDLNSFKEIIADYYNHFRKNPNSLIAKVFGIFIFEYKEGEKVSIFYSHDLKNYNYLKSFLFIFFKAYSNFNT